MRLRRHALARLGARLALFTILSSTAVVGVVEASSSATSLTNTKPSGLYACSMSSTSISSSCLAGALRDFNAARAKEGVKPMVLPSSFTSMSVPNQIFTLTNIERRDRGISSFVLLSSNLFTYVLNAANQALDPLFPSWTMEGGSNWASPKNSLWAFFMWMYDDGLGSGNLDCTSSNTSGCWGHRKNILGAYAAPRAMGAAVGSTGIATLMLGQDMHDVGPYLPNAPGSLSAKELSTRAVSLSWPAPTYRGAPVLGYRVRYDGHSWVNTYLHRYWTTPRLTVGYHTFSVRAYNRYGSSAYTRTVRIYVR
ncbi:MAG: fibronectin type III domain-containing protein [Marmoricola sp.]